MYVRSFADLDGHHWELATSAGPDPGGWRPPVPELAERRELPGVPEASRLSALRRLDGVGPCVGDGIECLPVVVGQPEQVLLLELQDATGHT